MSERAYLLIATVVIIGLLVLGSISIWPTFWPAPQNQTSNSETVKFVNKTLTDSSASIGYNIKASYPEFTGVPKPINTAIKNILNKQTSMFKDQVSESDKTIPVTTGGEQIITNNVSLANPKAISVWFKVMDAVPGMAHPNNYNLVYNYDLSSNKELQLSDLFDPKSNYVQTLSELAIKNLETQSELKDIEGLSFFVNQGAAPKAENFKLFNLTSRELILIFNPGTVAPEFAGTRTVKIPLSQLESILNK